MHTNLTFIQLIAQAQSEPYDSEAQIDAENGVYELLQAALPKERFWDFEDYCLHATLDERLSQAQKLWNDVHSLI